MPTTPPVRNAIRIARALALVLGGRGDADVSAHREAHAGEADREGRARRR